MPRSRPDARHIPNANALPFTAGRRTRELAVRSARGSRLPCSCVARPSSSKHPAYHDPNPAAFESHLTYLANHYSPVTGHSLPIATRPTSASSAVVISPGHEDSRQALARARKVTSIVSSGLGPLAGSPSRSLL